jgi:RNA polymerase sigma-70 factor (ECF subfamily)
MAEAARALGVPEGTVKSRLARARSSLASLLDLSTEGLS